MSENKKFKKAYICSPLNATTWEEIELNMLKARQYMNKVSAQLQCKAVAPHAYLPYILDDTCLEERELALSFGLSLLELCDCLIICTEAISSGMEGEIIHAIENNIPIYKLHEDFCIPIEIRIMKVIKE